MKAFHNRNTAPKSFKSQRPNGSTFKVVKKASVKLIHSKNKLVKQIPDHRVLDVTAIGEVTLVREIILDADSIFSAGILEGAPSYLKDELKRYAHLLQHDSLL